MAIDERKALSSNVIQNIVLENREKLSISGVLDVLSFDDQIVIVETELGLLTIKGENLKINKYMFSSNELYIKNKDHISNLSKICETFLSLKSSSESK